MTAYSVRPRTAEELLRDLDPEQREVVTAPPGPVCVLAGAGTGKTRAITARIAYLALTGAVSPASVLAVTFTTRAAAELRERLRMQGVPGVAARTFHSAALRQLQFFWPRVAGGPPPKVTEHKAPLLSEAAGRLRVRLDRSLLRDIAAELEWSKATLTSADGYARALTASGREAPAGLDVATTVRLMRAYEEVKRDRALMDFEDVLTYTVALLAERDEVAAQVRGQYRHFVVDEYQDVNPLQQQLLELWLGQRDDLCVVGDANQTIYSFTGATSDYLRGFSRRFPAARVISLVRNYRSTPQVLALANRLIESSPPGHGAPPPRLKAQAPAGPVPTLLPAGDDPGEANEVAAQVGRLHSRGVPLSEIAVLYRTNGQSESFEEALAAAGIPYLLRGGERFFARREVRDALLLLRGASRSAEQQDELVAAVRDVLSAAGWTSTPPQGGGAARDRWESLSALVGLAEQHAATSPEPSLRGFLGDLEERAAAQHAPVVQGVTLASLHAAKGLEWEAVFLVGLSEGLLPVSYAQTPDAVEEERRLLYVGITRARRHLVLSWARSRAPGGRASRSPSRFVKSLGLDAGATGGGTAGAARARSGRRSACRVCGRPLVDGVSRKLGRCEDCPAANYDEGLFERLRTWRSETARAQGMPAFVVFTDATLTAMVERRPTNRAELASIPGVGTAKLDRYAQALLDLLADQTDQRDQKDQKDHRDQKDQRDRKAQAEQVGR